jgi:hypothetical protein
MHKETVEHRSLTANALPYELIEDDARTVLKAVVHILEKDAV